MQKYIKSASTFQLSYGKHIMIEFTVFVIMVIVVVLPDPFRKMGDVEKSAEPQ